MSKSLNQLIDAAIAALASRQDLLETRRRCLAEEQAAFDVQRDLVNQAQDELEKLFDQVRAQGVAGTRWREERPAPPAPAPAKSTVFLFYNETKPSSPFLARLAEYLGLTKYGYLSPGVPFSPGHYSNSLLAVRTSDARARVRELESYRSYTEKEARQLLGLEATTPATAPEK